MAVYNSGSTRRGLIFLAGAAAIASAIPAQAVSIYKATPLGTISGRNNWATGINAGGDVTGTYGPLSSQADWRAFLFSGGSMKDVGTLSGIYSNANAINSSGMVTGSSLTSANKEHAFLYSGGKITDLGTLGGTYSVGNSINSAGQLTGASTTAGELAMRAFVYSGGKMTDLGTLPGQYSQNSVGMAINNSGQVTGYAYSFKDNTYTTAWTHAFLYQSGAMVDLGTLGGEISQGFGLNYAGYVTGNADLTGSVNYHAFVYKGGKMVDLGTLGGGDSSGYSINASEQVVGNSVVVDGSNHPFLYQDGVMYDLNSLVVSGIPGSMLTGDGAISINDNGQIALTGCSSNCDLTTAVLRSYRLEPVTDPDPDMVLVIEYYNADLKHYFITWAPEEIAILDAGVTTKGWKRTGFMFPAYKSPRAGTSPICRFYIPPGLGDSHFFGRGTDECSATAAKNPSFVLEDASFMHMYLPVAGVCPAGTSQVYRAFNNVAGSANHRYMRSVYIRDKMKVSGWVLEGDGPDLVVMCAPGA